MDQNENPLWLFQRDLANALCKKGDPSFYLLKMQEPIQIHLTDGRDVLGYYAGFSQAMLKIGFSRAHYPQIWVENRFDFQRSAVDFVEGLTVVESFVCQNPDETERLVNRYIPKRSPTQITIDGKDGLIDLIGFIGPTKGDVFELSHSAFLDGKYDSWFRPGIISESGLVRPNNNLSLKKIVSVSTLETFTPEPGFSDGEVLDFPI